MARGKKISDEMITEVIEFYNNGNSARKTAKQFGIGKTTVLDYLKPIEVKKQQEKERSIKNVIAVKKRRKKIKEDAIIYLGGECNLCGYNKCNRALEFHHIDPDLKEFGISASGITRSWERVKKELDKCLLVCANCHAELHDRLEKEVSRIKSK